MLFYLLNQIYLQYAGTRSFGSATTEANVVSPPPPEEREIEVCPLEDDIPLDAPHPSTMKRNSLDVYETEETRPLNNAELQRLVLLKQLKVLELKEKKLKKELGES